MTLIQSTPLDAQSERTNGARMRLYDEMVRPDGMVHRSIFTDPEIFKEEMKRIFGGTWLFLLHEAEIPRPNDFKAITVGRRPVIVTRGSDERIHALLNRCTHRGAMVCVEESGNAKNFQCPYHGWTFKNNGDLRSVTFADGYGPDFDKLAHRLGVFPRVESYRGYVFGSLSDDVESLTDWLGPARELLDWSMDPGDVSNMRVVETTTCLFHGNWKLQNDNNGDMYHVPFTHKSTLMMTRRRHGDGKSLDHFQGDDSPMCVKYYGHGHKLLDQRPSIDSVWERMRPVPGAETYSTALSEKAGEELAQTYREMIGRAGINLVLYPNLVVLGSGSFNVYEPIDVNKTAIHSYTILLDNVPSEVNTLRVRFAEDFVNVGNRDDNEVFERIQYALETVPEVEWLDFSKGLGTPNETEDADGVRTGRVSDETGIRGAYFWWRDLMTREMSRD